MTQAQLSPRPVSPRALITLAAAALALAGCPGDGNEEEAGADEYFYSCTGAPAGVTVFATDESYREIVDKESAGAVVTNDAEAATLMAPAPGGTLSAAAPPTFTLRTPGAALVPPGPGGCPAARPRPWWRWLAPIGTAYAHCPGVTGDNYLLRLTRAGERRPIYSALLSVTSFTPGAEPWRKALAGRKGQTLTLTILRAGLAGGRVTIGPFASSQPASFTAGD
jgi:hypothetical protein